MHSDGIKQAMRRLLWMIVALAVLTFLDWLIPSSLPHGNVVILGAFAVVEAGLVFYYFMHIRQLWHPHEEE